MEFHDQLQPVQEPVGDEKEESSMWKVQSANGASGGEIQKLKICRQKLTESPEIGETSLRKRSVTLKICLNCTQRVTLIILFRFWELS